MEEQLNKLKAIPIIHDKDHYYVFVSDGEKPVNGWYYDEYISKIRHTGGAEYGYAEHCKQIIYQSKPIHEGIPVIEVLPWIEDVEKLANLNWGNIHRTGILGFIDGHSKAKETFIFTEDQMEEAMGKAFAMGLELMDFGVARKEVKNYIQSLKQPKVYEVELEMIEFEVDMGLGEECIEYVKEIKLNSEGKPIITSWNEM